VIGSAAIAGFQEFPAMSGKAEALAQEVIDDLRRKHHPELASHSDFNSTGEIDMKLYPQF
jgi:hypothetical protein